MRGQKTTLKESGYEKKRSTAAGAAEGRARGRQRDVRRRRVAVHLYGRQRALRDDVGCHDGGPHAHLAFLQVDGFGVEVDAHKPVVVRLPGGLGLEAILQVRAEVFIYGHDVGPFHALQHLCIGARFFVEVATPRIIC